jgi:apolipoprotein N-acyltransferase
VLVGQVQGRSGITPYASWAARFGQWPLWLFAIAIVLVAFGLKRSAAGVYRPRG